MNNKLNNRGAVLIVTFMVIIVFVILAVSTFSGMMTESKSAQRHKELTEAFYVTEAAIDVGLAKLPADINDIALTNFVKGQYELDVTEVEANAKWKLVAYGYVPTKASSRATRVIEAYAQRKDLDDFWGYALYSADDINFVGNSYEVEGAVKYADAMSGSDDYVTPNPPVRDPDIAPLALLDFTYLRNIAVSQIKPNGQNNLYRASDLGHKTFPSTFWFTRADDGVDNNGNGTVDEYAEWIPNVLYIESDWILTGNETAGGFIIVGGDVIENVEVRGNASIDGCIYTRGYFQNKGGGNSLNIDGGVWTGNYTTLRGNAKIHDNQTYKNAIRQNINPSTAVQMISWLEVNS